MGGTAEGVDAVGIVVPGASGTRTGNLENPCLRLGARP
jgi:hypothetical protein